MFATEEPENPLAALGEIERAAMPRVGVPQVGAADAFPDEQGDPVPAAYSDEELLREKDFADYTDAERALARRLLARIAARSPQRMSRRTRPTRRRREAHDLRATVRASLRHGGELMERRYREPGAQAAPDRARLRRVGLDGAVRADAAPVPAGLGRRARAGRGVRVRHAAHARDARPARAAIRTGRWSAPPSASTDWSGGTRIGAALAELNREHGRRDRARRGRRDPLRRLGPRRPRAAAAPRWRGCAAPRTGWCGSTRSPPTRATSR